MWLVVGLGNPGAKYLLTRHNIGFMAVDGFLRGVGGPSPREERKSLTSRFRLDNQEVILAQPQTYMNKSGESVREIMDFYKIGLENLIVVHDDLDQPFGGLKIQKNRGAGGHNGLKSINEQLSSMDYYRIKLGIGRPANPKMDIANYVLQNFSSEEHAVLGDFLNRAGDAIEALIFEGYDKAASQHNRSPA